MLIGSHYKIKQLDSISINVGNCSIQSSDSVKHLGTYFDKIISMEEFVKYKVKIANFGVRTISRIRKYLSAEATKSSGIDFFIIDYGNSLLYGVNKNKIYQPQLVQN